MKTLLTGLLLGLAYVELGKTASFPAPQGHPGKCLGGKGKCINSERPGNPQVFKRVNGEGEQGERICVLGGESHHN